MEARIIEITSRDLERILGSLRFGVPQRVDFGIANYNHFIAEDHIPVDERESLAREELLLTGVPITSGMGNLDEVITSLIEHETTLDTERSQLYVCEGSTRGVLSQIFQHATAGGRSIALPLPNWSFWRQVPGSDGHKFEYLDATTEDRLVSGFKKIVKKGNVGALVLTNPTTPLSQDLSEDCVRSLDELASKNGVKLIIDDVLRGTRPEGDRDSIARWVQEPYTVEGLSHRFGGLWRSVAYALVPQGQNVKGLGNIKINDGSGFFAKLLDAVIKYASVPAIDELRKRNAEFDIGFRETAPRGVSIYRSYDSQLTTIATLPESCRFSGVDFAGFALSHGMEVMPMEAFYPDGYKVPKTMRNKLRFSVGNLPSKVMRPHARSLGEGLQVFSDITHKRK